MSYRPYPDVHRARHQLERGRVRPRPKLWAVGQVVTPRDFGLTPAAGPNRLGEALARNLAEWGEAFRAMGQQGRGDR